MSEHAVFVLDAVGTWVHDTGADLPANIFTGLSKLFVQITRLPYKFEISKLQGGGGVPGSYGGMGFFARSLKLKLFKRNGWG